MHEMLLLLCSSAAAWREAAALRRRTRQLKLVKWVSVVYTSLRLRQRRLRCRCDVNAQAEMPAISFEHERKQNDLKISDWNECNFLKAALWWNSSQTPPVVFCICSYTCPYLCICIFLCICVCISVWLCRVGKVRFWLELHKASECRTRG